jgi:hypothetical protein
MIFRLENELMPMLKNAKKNVPFNRNFYQVNNTFFHTHPGVPNFQETNFGEYSKQCPSQNRYKPNHVRFII